MSTPSLLEVERPSAALIPVADPNVFMNVIERAATDPNVNVEKMEKLWEMYKNIVQWQAEKSFNAAFAQMQAQMPVITERGEIKDGNGKVRSQYAFFEDINDVVKPLLQEYGFAVMFKTEDADLETVRVVGILMHKDGHRESCPLPLPADNSGSKNSVQARGSSISYAKRYILIDLLNITTRGEDDDGQAGGAKTITEDQVLELQKVIADNNLDQKAFLTYMRVSNLTLIPAAKFEEAKTALAKKINAGKKGGK